MANMDISFESITLKVTIVSYPNSVASYLQELKLLVDHGGEIMAMHVEYLMEEPLLLVLAVDTRVIIFQLKDILNKTPGKSFRILFWRCGDCKVVGYKEPKPEMFVPGCYYDLSQFDDRPYDRFCCGLGKLYKEVLGLEFPCYRSDASIGSSFFTDICIDDWRTACCSSDD